MQGTLAREHVSMQGTLEREHVSMQGTLAREHVSMQGTLASEPVSTQGTLAREHVFRTQGTLFSRLKYSHFLLFLSLSTVLIHQFHSYTKILTLIPCIPIIPTLIPCIPIIPTLIPRILIIPIILFSNSPFRLLQIVATLVVR